MRWGIALGALAVGAGAWAWSTGRLAGLLPKATTAPKQLPPAGATAASELETDAVKAAVDAALLG